MLLPLQLLGGAPWKPLQAFELRIAHRRRDEHLPGVRGQLLLVLQVLFPQSLPQCSCERHEVRLCNCDLVLEVSAARRGRLGD